MGGGILENLKYVEKKIKQGNVKCIGAYTITAIKGNYSILPNLFAIENSESTKAIKDAENKKRFRKGLEQRYDEEKEPVEIARSIKHSLTAVERYIDSFCRVVYCQRRFRNNLQTALVVGASIHTVNTYLGLHSEWCEDPAYRDRIVEIEERGRIYYKNVDFKKSMG